MCSLLSTHQEWIFRMITTLFNFSKISWGIYWSLPKKDYVPALCLASVGLCIFLSKINWWQQTRNKSYLGTFPPSLDRPYICQLLLWGLKVVIKLMQINASLPAEICCRIKGKSLSTLYQRPRETVFHEQALFAYRCEVSCGIDRPAERHGGMSTGMKIWSLCI